MLSNFMFRLSLFLDICRLSSFKFGLCCQVASMDNVVKLQVWTMMSSFKFGLSCQSSSLDYVVMLDVGLFTKFQVSSLDYVAKLQVWTIVVI